MSFGGLGALLVTGDDGVEGAAVAEALAAGLDPALAAAQRLRVGLHAHQGADPGGVVDDAVVVAAGVGELVVDLAER